MGIGAVVAELRRQNEADRRSVHRQLEHLERRVQEQLTAPAAGRERWADLQGSVTGMLEEMSSLARRVDGLEEKLRLRASGCEELVRQRARELEQQVHTLQQKALLASTTSEEMSKRHTTRLRKLGQAVEEHAQRLTTVEEASRRPASVDPAHLEARFAQLERQVLNHEDELRNLAPSAPDTARGVSDVGNAALLAAEVRPGQTAGGRGEEDFDSMLRALEREVSSLAQRTSVQLDEHASALANLRVRSDGQEQRLSAASERLENVVNPPLEALRAEVAQLREHDRLEAKTQLEHVGRSMQALAETSEEATAELRTKLKELRSEMQALEPRAEEHPLIQKLAAGQEQAMRRVEAVLAEVPRLGHGAAALPEELCSALVRLDAAEHRLDCLEQANGEEELAEKADRAEITRVDAALQELSEPLRRLSQRTASTENRTVALERRLEQLQQLQGTMGASLHSPGHDRLEELSAAAAGPSMDALADLTARVIEIESLLEHGHSVDAGAAPAASHADVDGVALHSLRVRLTELEEQLAELRGHTPSSSREQADHGSQSLHRLANTEEATRALQQQLQQLVADQRKLEHAASFTAGHDERLGGLERSSREVLQQVQELWQERQASERSAAFEHTAQSLHRELRELREGTSDFQSKASAALHDQRISGLESATNLLRDGLEERLLAAERAAAELRGKLEALSGSAREAERGHEERSQSLEAQLGGLSERLQKLQSQGTGSEAAEALEVKVVFELMELKEGVAQGKVEHSAHVEQLASHASQLAELRTGAASLRESLEAREGASRELAELQRQAGQLADGLARVEGELEACKATQFGVTSLQGTLEAMQGDLQELKGSDTVVQEQLQRLQTAQEQQRERAEAQVPNAEQHAEKLAEAMRLLGVRESAAEALEERLEKLARDHARLEERHNSYGERVTGVAQRVERSEQALALDLSELSRKVTGHEEVNNSLRADLRLVEASLKELRDQRERVVQHSAEQAAPASGAGGALVAELEGRVRDLQRQVSDEFSCLMRQQKELAQVTEKRQPSDAVERKVERNAAELSRQVAAELQDLQDHQQELRTVKDLVLSLSKKAPAEHDAVDRGTPGKLEAHEYSLSQQLRKLQSEHEELAGSRIGALEMRMDQLRSDHEDLAHTKLLGSDFVERVTDVMQRLKGGEEKIAAVEKQLEQPIKALDARLELLRNDHEASKQNEDVTHRLGELAKRLAASEAALEALQRRTPGGAPSELEARVRELQRQVEDELKCLARHQQELVRAGGNSSAASVLGRAQDTTLASAASAGPAMAAGEVEQAVQELSKLVAGELRELREHQQDLGRVKALADHGGAVPHHSLANGQGLHLGEDGNAEKRLPKQLEAQATELAKQVSVELQALTGQQAELRQTKATLGDLVGKVQDLSEGLAKCDSTCSGLQQQLKAKVHGREFEESTGE